MPTAPGDMRLPAIVRMNQTMGLKLPKWKIVLK